MKQITDFIPADKLLHLQGGLILAMLITPLSNPYAGVVVALGVGAIKEWILDAWILKGNVEANDFYATVAGGVIGALLSVGLASVGHLV